MEITGDISAESINWRQSPFGEPGLSSQHLTSAQPRPFVRVWRVDQQMATLSLSLYLSNNKIFKAYFKSLVQREYIQETSVYLKFPTSLCLFFYFQMNKLMSLTSECLIQDHIAT